MRFSSFLLSLSSADQSKVNFSLFLCLVSCVRKSRLICSEAKRRDYPIKIHDMSYGEVGGYGRKVAHTGQMFKLKL